jgi:predicted nucleotidyltransferase
LLGAAGKGVLIFLYTTVYNDLAQVVPARLGKDLVRSLDRLISEGKYVSRSDAVRDAVRMLLRKNRSGAASPQMYRIVAEIASAILAERLGHTVTDIVLFGSVASGRQTDESDIDLLILVKGSPPDRTTLDIIDELYTIMLASGTAITPIVYEQNEFKQMFREGIAFAQEVIDKAIPLHGAVLDELRRQKASR